VVFARADGMVHAVNAAFRAFLAAEFREFVVCGTRLDAVLPLAAEPALAAMLRDAAAGETMHRDGVRFACVSAPDVPWDIDLSPLPAIDEYDDLLVLAVTHAAAPAVPSEREAQLLDRVEEMQLLNDALIGSVQQKHLFLTAMSHRLRTPLTSIIGFGEMLAAGDVADPADQCMVSEDIVAAAQQMLGLIDDMIELARLDAGGLRLRRETLAVTDLIDEARESLEILAAARRQHVVAPAPDAGLRAYADGRWTVQVILKLGMNGLRFSPTGGTVMLRGRDLDATHVAIEVEDTGVGIRAAEQATIFEAFAANADAQERGGGTGLELALAKRLVELQGGTITFASARGVGTTFTVTLPKPVADLAPPTH